MKKYIAVAGNIGVGKSTLVTGSRRALRFLVSLSLPIFLFQIGALAVNQTQTIMLAHRCDMSVVASYSIAMRNFCWSFGVVHVGTSSFVPALREAYEHGDHDWTRRAFARLLRFRRAMTTGAGCAFILLGDTLLRLWLRRYAIALGCESRASGCALGGEQPARGPPPRRSCCPSWTASGSTWWRCSSTEPRPTVGSPIG